MKTKTEQKPSDASNGGACRDCPPSPGSGSPDNEVTMFGVNYDGTLTGDDDEYYEAEDNTCPRCHGTGGDPMDNGCTPCDRCDGEGYEWWK